MNEWQIKFDWQEDDNSPSGGMYTFTVSRIGLTSFEVTHHNMSTAWVDTLGELQSRGEL